FFGNRLRSGLAGAEDRHGHVVVRLKWGNFWFGFGFGASGLLGSRLFFGLGFRLGARARGFGGNGLWLRLDFFLARGLVLGFFDHGHRFLHRLFGASRLWLGNFYGSLFDLRLSRRLDGRLGFGLGGSSGS